MVVNLFPVIIEVPSGEDEDNKTIMMMFIMTLAAGSFYNRKI